MLRHSANCCPSHSPPPLPLLPPSSFRLLLPLLISPPAFSPPFTPLPLSHLLHLLFSFHLLSSAATCLLSPPPPLEPPPPAPSFHPRPAPLFIMYSSSAHLSQRVSAALAFRLSRHDIPSSSSSLIHLTLVIAAYH